MDIFKYLTEAAISKIKSDPRLLSEVSARLAAIKAEASAEAMAIFQAQQKEAKQVTPKNEPISDTTKTIIEEKEKPKGIKNLMPSKPTPQSIEQFSKPSSTSYTVPNNKKAEIQETEKPKRIKNLIPTKPIAQPAGQFSKPTSTFYAVPEYKKAEEEFRLTPFEGVVNSVETQEKVRVQPNSPNQLELDFNKNPEEIKSEFRLSNLMPSKPTLQSDTKMPIGINIDYGSTYPFTTKSNVIQKEDDSPLKVSTVEEKPKSDTKLLTHLKDTVPTQQVGETNVKPIVPETTVTETKPAVQVEEKIVNKPPPVVSNIIDFYPKLDLSETPDLNIELDYDVLRLSPKEPPVNSLAVGTQTPPIKPEPIIQPPVVTPVQQPVTPTPAPTPKPPVNTVPKPKKPKSKKPKPPKVAPTPVPPVVPPQPIPTGPPNPLQNIGHSASIYSYDIETTGLDFKKSKIWQQGLAQFDFNTQTFKTIETEHLPEQVKDITELEQLMKTSNGAFSEDMYTKGTFNSLFDSYKKGTTSTVEQGLLDTLGKISKGNALLLQNMNFENNMIQGALNRGEISQSAIDSIRANMSYVDIDPVSGEKIGFGARPFAVQKSMREADFIFSAKYLKYRKSQDFNSYVEKLNEGFDHYRTFIQDLNSSKGTVLVEQMDITKIFLGNLAQQGLIEKELATTGLNINFFTQVLKGADEKHTAASDAMDTLQIFDKLSTSIDKLRTNQIDKDIQDLAAKIREAHPEEVNRKFLKTLQSILNDFKERGYTKETNRTGSFYAPEKLIHETETGITHKLERMSTKQSSRNIYDIHEAITSHAKYFDEMYAKNINGFDRNLFTGTLFQMMDEGASADDLHYFASRFNIPQATEPFKGKVVNPLNVLEKKGGNGVIPLAALGLAGLAGMALNPGKVNDSTKEDKYKDVPVSYQFYDEQYLGTGFVEFRDRNKRYMY